MDYIVENSEYTTKLGSGETNDTAELEGFLSWYTVGRPISRDVLFGFLSEVPVTRTVNCWAA